MKSRPRCDTCADRDSDPGDFVLEHLTFAGVDAGADLDAQLTDSVADCAGTANGSCGAVEACEEPVSCGVDLQAAIADELSPNGRVVPLKPITRTDPSEPEEATVIPATLSKPKHAASEYGQALSDAPWENRIDTSRDLGDGIDPDLLPPEQFLE
jgi:hypothetical protein